MSYLSEKVHLLHVEQVITPESPPPSNKIQATGIPPGVRHIQLTFINITEPVSIESYLMITAEPLVDVGSLIVQCFEGDKEANEVCSKPVVHFNVTSLEHTFPHLQALTLCGVFTQDTVANLSFPWDPNPLLLQLNLSHSKYNQKQLYNGGFPTQSENRKFTRALVVNGDMHIDIKQICPYQRSVNMLSIKQYPSKSIPADCLTPTEGHESDLYYLDFTGTKITELPQKLFKGLSKLKALHLPGLPITNISPGTFDDMASLQTLDIDYADLREIKAGTFANLVSLRRMFLHGNHRLTIIEPNSFPIFSHNLTFVDLRWCDLHTLPVDCLRLPNLDLCDCDHNLNLSLRNLSGLISYFDPVRMYLVQPLAYYGETRSHLDVGIMHETDQSELSLRDCDVTHLDFNSSWTM